MKDQPVDISAERAQSEVAVLQQILHLLATLDSEARRRIVSTIATFYSLHTNGIDVRDDPSSAPNRVFERVERPFKFSEEIPATIVTPSIKQFLLEKAPVTDVERVACLAYYLAHYRSIQHFKTKDISDLNTEGAQRRFSNAAFAVENATKTGYLVPSVKGAKQLSAAGERAVAALPDRVAAREALEHATLRRRRRSNASTDKE